MRQRGWIAAMGSVMLGVSCGGDDGGGGNVTFPTIPPAIAAAVCLRGNITTGQTVNGTLAVTDCDDGTAYYDSYLLKVAANGTYDVSMSSGTFDTYLTLLRIDSIIGDTAAYVTVVDFNDDGPSGTNSLIANVALLAADDYALAASGYNYAEVGNYSVHIQ